MWSWWEYINLDGYNEEIILKDIKATRSHKRTRFLQKGISGKKNGSQGK